MDVTRDANTKNYFFEGTTGRGDTVTRVCRSYLVGFWLQKNKVVGLD